MLFLSNGCAVNGPTDLFKGDDEVQILFFCPTVAPPDAVYIFFVCYLVVCMNIKVARLQENSAQQAGTIRALQSMTDQIPRRFELEIVKHAAQQMAPQLQSEADKVNFLQYFQQRREIKHWS